MSYRHFEGIEREGTQDTSDRKLVCHFVAFQQPGYVSGQASIGWIGLWDKEMGSVEMLVELLVAEEVLSRRRG